MLDLSKNVKQKFNPNLSYLRANFIDLQHQLLNKYFRSNKTENWWSPINLNTIKELIDWVKMGSLI